MGLFDWFRRKKELPIEAQKWNKMWDLWMEEKTATPYTELMTYQSEVNNGGHMQFFDNVSNTSDLPKHISALYQILDGALRENLKKAYDAYLEYKANAEPDDDDAFDTLLDACDDVFYENENDIERVLKEYAATIEL